MTEDSYAKNNAENQPGDDKIAQGFAALDGIAVPPAEVVLARARVGSGKAGSTPSAAGGWRSGVLQYRFVVAAAAAVVVVVAAVTLSSQGEPVGDDGVASEPVLESESPDDTDGSNDADADSSSTGNQPAASDTENSDTENSDTENSYAAPGAGSAEDGSEVKSPMTEGAEAGASTTGAGGSIEGVEPDSGEPPPGTESENVGSSEATTRVSGVITEVLLDCVSHQVLGPDGSVQDSGQVTCDGGSYIVVDRTRVYTTSGFTSVDNAYDKHDPQARPGVSVTVVAAPINGGPLSLKCDACNMWIE